MPRFFSILIVMWICIAVAAGFSGWALVSLHAAQIDEALQREAASWCAALQGREVRNVQRLQSVVAALLQNESAMRGLLDWDEPEIRSWLSSSRIGGGFEMLSVATRDGSRELTSLVESPQGVTAVRPFVIGSREFVLSGMTAWHSDDFVRQQGRNPAFTLDLLSEQVDVLRVGITVDAGTCEGIGGARWHIANDPQQHTDGVDRGKLLWGVGTLLAALLAIPGAWLLARRDREPLLRLQRMVEEIGAGGADYTFAAPSEGVDRLAVTFSELRRTLDEQTERARLAESVSAWSDVARHVAHEVKNPLVPIRLTVQNLQRARDKAPERMDELFEQGCRTILEEVDQLDRLVASFAEFARLPAPAFQDCDLVSIVGQGLDLYDADDGLMIQRDLPRSAPVHADPDQLLRVMKNVVGNAVEAMAGRAARCLTVLLVERGAGYDLTVCDNGPGLDREAVANVFHEGFTTKSNGSGLGLAITRRIIVEHRGWIRLESAPSGGLLVRIRLPRKQSDRGS